MQVQATNLSVVFNRIREGTNYRHIFEFIKVDKIGDLLRKGPLSPKSNGASKLKNADIPTYI